MTDTKVLLYSGGMDSWLIDKLWKPDFKLFVDIGTDSNKLEMKMLPSDVLIEKVNLACHEIASQNYYLPLRNLFLVTFAAYYGNVICLGATDSSTHYDKSTKFTEDTGKLLTYLLSEKLDNWNVRVVTPYYQESKYNLLVMYLNQGGSIDKAFNETTSCYAPVNDEECWNCSSCFKKFIAFDRVGYKFPQNIIDKWLSYYEFNHINGNLGYNKSQSLNTASGIYNKYKGV